MAAKSPAAKTAPAQGCKAKTCKKADPAATTTGHEFSLMAPEAGEVFVVGDFNDWKNGKDKLRKFKTGLHKKNVKLQPGRYEYRFVVDGNWWTDPANEQRCRNAYGEDNSVLEIC